MSISIASQLNRLICDSLSVGMLPMHKLIHLRPFMRHLFDDPNTAIQITKIGRAILVACLLRLTEIVVNMLGSSQAGYKRIQRFLKQCGSCQALWPLF